MYEIVLYDLVMSHVAISTCCAISRYEIMLMNDIIYDKLLDIMRGDFIYDLYDITPPPHLRCIRYE